jgi:hypothetical protein
MDNIEDYNNIDNNSDDKFDNFIDSQLEFYNKIKSQNKHTGVRITDNNNNYKFDPFQGYNPFIMDVSNSNTFIDNIIDYDNLNLNIDTYSKDELLRLFNIDSVVLNNNHIKNAKKIVLKTHPDKSRLDPKYFIFFSKAYKRLQNIYEFQNKTINKKNDNNDYFDENKYNVLQQFITNNVELNNTSNFNSWFNQQFEKYNINESQGYANWLKTDEGIIDISNNIQENIHIEIEKYKKQVQSLVSYKGLNNKYNNSNITCSSLIDNNNNFSSNSLFTNSIQYTDIKEAFTETIIPITTEDYTNIKKYNNIDEYIQVRNNQDITPLDKEQSINILFHNNKQNDEDSITLAYYYANEIEINNKKQEQFWSNLRQLT